MASLTDRIIAFADDVDKGGRQASLLPLVSLSLERLYREVARPKEEGADAPTIGEARMKVPRMFARVRVAFRPCQGKVMAGQAGPPGKQERGGSDVCGDTVLPDDRRFGR